MTYSQQTWTDGAGGGTPISAARLNHMEAGITAAAAPAPPSSTSVRTYYVDPASGNDANDGRTWQTAAATIAAALTACNGTGEIRLSRGIHNVTATLVIPQAVKLRGFGSLISQETEIVWTGADDGSYVIRTAGDSSGSDFSRGELSGFLLRPNATKPGGGAYANLNGIYARNLQNGSYISNIRVQDFPGKGVRSDWANAAVPAGAFPGWVTFDRVWSTGNNVNWNIAGGFTSVLYNMCAGDVSTNTTDVFIIDPPTGGTVLGRQGNHILVGFKSEDNGSPTGGGADYFTINSDAGVSFLGCSAKKGTAGTKPWINYTATPGSQNAVPGSIPITLQNCQTSNLPVAVQGPTGASLLAPSVGTGGQSFNIASWSGHANAPMKWSGTHSGFVSDGVTVLPADGTVPALLAGSAPVPTVAPHQFQAPVFTHTFTAANSTTTIPAPDAGPAGTAAAGTWGISSNKAYLVSSTNNALYSWDAGLADGTFHADITLSSGQGFPGLAIRTIDASNGLSVRYKSTTGELLLMKTVGGTLTGLKATTTAWAAGATRHLSISLQGPVITAYLDGVQVLTYTLTGTDATSFTTPTVIGMRQNGNLTADSNADDGGSRYDNLSFVAAVVRISTGGALQVLSGGTWTTVGTGGGGGAPAAHAASHNIGGSDQLTFPNRVLAVSAPTISPGVVNTTTETNLFSFTVPATSVAAGDVLDLDLAWDLLNNSGAAVTYTFKYKLGATTVFAPVGISYAASANRFKVSARVSILLASLTDQRWSAQQDGSGAFTAAMGTFANNNTLTGVGTSTEDLSTDKVLAVTVTMGTANALADCRPVMAVLRRGR